MARTDRGKNGGGKNIVRRRASRRQNFRLPNIPHWVTLWGMNDLALRVSDRRGLLTPLILARIYVESWQDTYAGILPHSLLAAMSIKTHTARWQSQFAARLGDRGGGPQSWRGRSGQPGRRARPRPGF